jgi:hypothetical protein
VQRGRERLRALVARGDDTPAPVLREAERLRLKNYVDRFNAHDFDAVRAMLAEDVQIEVVNRLRSDGKATSLYGRAYPQLSTERHSSVSSATGRARLAIRRASSGFQSSPARNAPRIASTR